MTDTLPLKPIDADTVEKYRGAIDERAAIAETVAPLVEAGLRHVYSAPVVPSSAAGRPTTCCSRRLPSPSFSCKATSSTAAPRP